MRYRARAVKEPPRSLWSLPPEGARSTLGAARRYGTPTEFGAICAFLCSVHAAYITGQNVLADGGAYPGTY